jgi:hypothetical protein
MILQKENQQEYSKKNKIKNNPKKNLVRLAKISAE